MSGHALLSASGAHRWLRCTRSARLTEGLPDRTGVAAQEGTLAHALAEAKLRHHFCPAAFGKKELAARVKELKKDPLWNDEMQGHTDEYLDYAKAAALAFASTPHAMIERRLDYGAYAPEGFGTADCVLAGGDAIHVIDFKYGQSRPEVSAVRNPQLSLYALGAYESLKIFYPVKRIKMTIVQPRLDNTSEWECGLYDLLDWGEWVKGRARLAWEGGGEYFVDGGVCKFCRIRDACRARSDYYSRTDFSIEELPPLISPEEAGARLTALEGVAKYQTDLEAWALSECLAGREVPGWKAVEGRSQRAWTDLEAAHKALTDGGISEELLYERKPLTLAQTEKAVGKEAFKELAGGFVTKPPGKPTLVKESDKRPAITNRITAEEAFKEE